MQPDKSGVLRGSVNRQKGRLSQLLHLDLTASSLPPTCLSRQRMRCSPRVLVNQQISQSRSTSQKKE